MSSFSVIWDRSAENDLAHFWLMEDVRTAVEQATRDSDLQLAHEPACSQAMEREGLWFLDIPPLRFCYEIDQVHKVVHVVGLALLMKK